MRALIIRRIGLLETGSGGPIIVGRADNGDVPVSYTHLDVYKRQGRHCHCR